MSTQPIPRRTVLKAMGAVVPLPLLEAMLPRSIRAANTSKSTVSQPPLPGQRYVFRPLSTGVEARRSFGLVRSQSYCRGESRAWPNSWRWRFGSSSSFVTVW